jgi:hypothetical protein
VAGKILNSYPDYAKSSPDFTLRIIEKISSYPEDIQDALCDKDHGVQTKSTYLPSVSTIADFADRLVFEKARNAEFDRRFSKRHATPWVYSQKPFRPFPQLWKTFGDEYMDTIAQTKGCTFDKLQDACKALMSDSKQAAENILGRKPNSEPKI